MATQITSFVKNPELHVLALSADGFQEVPAKKRLSSWPTRCFKKIHNDGLVVEIQHVDMSRPPLEIGGNHQATIVMDFVFDRKALKRLTKEFRQVASQDSTRTNAFNALLSEYHGSIQALRKLSEAPIKNKEDAKLIKEFLSAVPEPPPGPDHDKK